MRDGEIIVDFMTIREETKKIKNDYETFYYIVSCIIKTNQRTIHVEEEVTEIN